MMADPSEFTIERLAEQTMRMPQSTAEQVTETVTVEEAAK
jgi:hypothetical protein